MFLQKQGKTVKRSTGEFVVDYVGEKRLEAIPTKIFPVYSLKYGKIAKNKTNICKNILYWRIDSNDIILKRFKNLKGDERC